MPTNATLTITNVGTDQLGPYFVVVSNSFGSATSQMAFLQLLVKPLITQSPQSQTVAAGSNATFSVIVTNTATFPATLTLFGPPSVITMAASNVTSTAATLNGTVNPSGYGTTAWFEYGLTTNYGRITTSTNLGDGTGLVPVSTTIGGLLPGTSHHFRLVATNSVGTTVGKDLAFQTVSPLFISHCARVENGHFHLEFSGLAGANHRVLASTNLVDWNEVGAPTETAPGTFEFIHTNAPNYEWCFYRVKRP